MLLISPTGHLRGTIPIRLGDQPHQDIHPSLLQADVSARYKKSASLLRLGNNGLRGVLYYIYHNRTHYCLQVNFPSTNERHVGIMTDKFIVQ
jgi:hypothetical protein